MQDRQPRQTATVLQAGTAAASGRGDARGPVAVVTAVSGGHAVVRADRAACPRCESGQGCGAGLLNRSAGYRELSLPARSGGLRLQPGMQVRLDLPRGALTAGAVCAYGLPLAGVLVATALAHSAGAGDSGALGSALLGLAGGCLFGAILAARRRIRIEPASVASSAERSGS